MQHISSTHMALLCRGACYKPWQVLILGKQHDCFTHVFPLLGPGVSIILSAPLAPRLGFPEWRIAAEKG